MVGGCSSVMTLACRDAVIASIFISGLWATEWTSCSERTSCPGLPTDDGTASEHASSALAPEAMLRAKIGLVRLNVVSSRRTLTRTSAHCSPGKSAPNGDADEITKICVRRLRVSDGWRTRAHSNRNGSRLAPAPFLATT